MPALILTAVGCATPLQKRFQAHIDYLADDRLEGRGIGSDGIEMAADYIAEQFLQIGLTPAGENGTYFQTFSMTLHRTLDDASRLTLTGDAAEPQLRKDFIPFNFSSEDTFDAEVVFCGYGIVSEDRQRDDFIHADVTDRVALLLRGEPGSWADEHGNATQHAMLRNKVYNVKDRGAVAILIVNQAPAEGTADELISFEAQGAAAYGMPAFHVSRAWVEASLAAAGADSLTTLQDRLDSGGYVSRKLPGVRSSGQAVFSKNSASTRNVLGLLRGEGPQGDEVVVIGAHYDHLGIRKPMMRKFKAGKLVKEALPPAIHNGADDNASGTSGLIEIARLLAADAVLKRSVLFIAFTAEETGLHGSKHFVDNPTIPLDGAVAMLNLDMIGRMPPGSDTIQVFGVNCGLGFSKIVQRAARAEGLKVAPSPDTGGRSDHASFIRKEIPSMHFFSGQHSDYHKPSDDSDKINARDGARITRLVYHIARDVADLDARPTFQAVKRDKADPSGGTPTYRVVMGLAPGYGDDGKAGMAVEAVSPEGPADLAGMKTGDRIVKIDGKKVANIYDYMGATRNRKPGDTVDVVVVRQGREITLRVTLAPAK